MRETPHWKPVVRSMTHSSVACGPTLTPVTTTALPPLPATSAAAPPVEAAQDWSGGELEPLPDEHEALTKSVFGWSGQGSSGKEGGPCQTVQLLSPSQAAPTTAGARLSLHAPGAGASHCVPPVP